MRRALLAATLLVALAAAALYAGLPYLSSSERLRLALQAEIAERTGYEIRANGLRIGYDLTLEVKGWSLAAPGREPALSGELLRLRAPWIRAAETGYELGGLEVVGIELDQRRLQEFTASDEPGENAEAVRIALSSVDLDRAFVLAEAAGSLQRIGPLRATLRPQAQGGLASEVDLVLSPQLPPIRAVGTVHDITSDSPALDFELAWKGVALQDIGSFMPESWRGTLAGLADVGVRVRADRASVEVTTSEEGIAVSELSVAHEGSAAGAQSVHLQGRLKVDENSNKALSFQMQAKSVSANDASFLRLADKASIECSFDGTVAADAAVNGRTSLQVSEGEFLWDRFYLDLGRYKPRAEAVVSYSSDTVSFRDAEVILEGVGSWRGSAQVPTSSGRYTASGRIELTHIGRALEVTVREPFKEAYPGLAKTEATGTADADFEAQLEADGSFRLLGRAAVRNGTLDWPEHALRIKGFQMELPLNLGTASVPERKGKGRIAIATMEVFGTRLENLASGLATGPNSIRSTQTIFTPLLGGTLELGPVLATGILNSPRVSTSLKLGSLALEQLTAALALPSATGTLDADLSEIVYEDHAVRSSGGVAVRAFDGSIGVTNIGASELFSRVPAFSMNIDFRDISLARLTETVEVGHMSGILQGGIHNLILVQGQPVSMNARVETTPKRGVPQSISVTALNQITIFSGSGSNALSRGILGFFDSYRYAKMGFTSQLENDRFTLAGIEKYDGKDFLVVGSMLPPSVNVISRSQVIGFSEMVKRVARIQEAGAPTQQGSDTK